MKNTKKFTRNEIRQRALWLAKSCLKRYNVAPEWQDPDNLAKFIIEHGYQPGQYLSPLFFNRPLSPTNHRLYYRDNTKSALKRARAIAEAITNKYPDEVCQQWQDPEKLARDLVNHGLQPRDLVYRSDEDSPYSPDNIYFTSK